jgi:hypothetical protein
MRTLDIPAVVEVTPGRFISIDACNYEHLLLARKTEKDLSRRRMLDRLLRVYRPMWSINPSMTLKQLGMQRE